LCELTSASGAMAGSMSSVWKAPETASGRTMRAPKSALAMRDTSATAAAVPGAIQRERGWKGNICKGCASTVTRTASTKGLIVIAGER